MTDAEVASQRASEPKRAPLTMTFAVSCIRIPTDSQQSPRARKQKFFLAHGNIGVADPRKMFLSLEPGVVCNLWGVKGLLANKTNRKTDQAGVPICQQPYDSFKTCCSSVAMNGHFSPPPQIPLAAEDSLGPSRTAAARALSTSRNGAFPARGREAFWKRQLPGAPRHGPDG